MLSDPLLSIWTREGWAYLAAILDVYSRRVVGWALDRRPTTGLTRKAFERALGQRHIEPGLIHHSDQGAQYANHEYQTLLKQHGIQGSMGKQGVCYDNAMAESFFHTLKTEHTYWNSYQTRKEAEQSLFNYIEMFYNAERLHSGVGYKSPLAFEKQSSLTYGMSTLSGKDQSVPLFQGSGILALFRHEKTETTVVLLVQLFEVNQMFGDLY